MYDRIVGHSARLLTGIYDSFSPWQKEETETPIDEMAGIEEVDEVTFPVSFKSIEDVLQSRTQERPMAVEAKNMIMYVSTTDAPLYINPTVEFDTTIAVLPYGEMVMMLDIQGRFYKVAWQDLIGWMLKDDLVDRAARTRPEFIIGKENLADDANTIQVRAMLGDPFNAAQSDFPLQAGEYVLYKLKEKGRTIVWPPTRPRTPGRWHSILGGVPRIHIGVVPKVRSIMEYVHDDDSGHLAYVEDVRSDETISVSEADHPDSGKYNERLLTKEEWKELRPVFIEVQ